MRIADAWAELARSLDGLRVAFYESYEPVHGFLPGSPASDECSRDATLAGTWGTSPVRDANIAPLSPLLVLFDHLDTLASVFRSPGGVTASHTLARAILDIAIGPWYLLEPGIGERERVRRYMNLRLQSLKEQVQLEAGSDSTAIRDHSTDRIALITKAARAHGFEVRREGDRYRAPYLDSQMPSTTSLAAEMIAPQAPTLGPLFWRMGSAIAHGQHHGISMFFERQDLAVDPAHGDAAVRIQTSSKDTALRCGGAPLAVIATLGRFFAQYGWDATKLRAAEADVIDVCQTVAGVQKSGIPGTFRAKGSASA
ncbi:hypothetical protein [Streptomyces canus]|uniref:hypothetical protein n=1 Tax=Streptomyces canus TaxID=58343 RepID=UPI0027D8EFF5|nr:hypothetical protein [Streptomyces canus]